MFRLSLFSSRLNCDTSHIVIRSLASNAIRGKLSENMINRQMKMMNRMEEEIQISMENIIKNRKIKNKQKKHLLTTTTFLDKERESLHNNMAVGSPEQLAIRRDGMPKTFLTTRMKVFNMNFSRAVAEAFIMDESLSKTSQSYKIYITQVRVATDFKLLNIYWTTSRTDVDLDEISNWLNSQRSKLHSAMIDTQYANSVPWISFVYDVKLSYEQQVQQLLEQVKDDLELEDNHKSVPQDDGVDEKSLLEKSIVFDNPIQEFDLDEYYRKILKCDDPYINLRFVSPEGMDQSFGSLEYDSMINKVLVNLKRTRQKVQTHSGPFQATDNNQIGIHLPPIDMKQHIVANPEVDYNTDERIRAIKKFVELNKKNRTKMENRLKLKILREECARFATYESIRDRMEQEMEQQFEDN